MPLPWMHFSPASITSHFDESIMMGTRAISGSPAIRFRKRTIAALLSSMASSMLMSMIWAPFSTCWRATASACSKSPLRIMRAKAFEPVTLVRSPMLTNRLPAPMLTGSRPDSRIEGAAGGATGARGSAWELARWGMLMHSKIGWMSAVAGRAGQAAMRGSEPGGRRGVRPSQRSSEQMQILCGRAVRPARGAPRLARGALRLIQVRMALDSASMLNKNGSHLQ